jgi:hypothetical protein
VLADSGCWNVPVQYQVRTRKICPQGVLYAGAPGGKKKRKGKRRERKRKREREKEELNRNK